MNFVKGKLSLVGAILFTIILSVLRYFQISMGTELPSGFYMQGQEVFNVGFNVILAAVGICTVLAVVFELKEKYGNSKKKISIINKPVVGRAAAVVGVCFILSGASMSISVINGFTSVITIDTVFSALSCVALIIGGISAFSTSKLSAPLTVTALITIITFLVKAVFYYLDNTVITVMPQKLMMMLYLVVSALFWINLGRMLSGGEKKLTRIAMMSAGFFCGITTFANSVSTIIFAAVNPEKWDMLTDLPDIEFMITGVTAAVIAAAYLTTNTQKPGRVLIKEEYLEDIPDFEEDKE